MKITLILLAAGNSCRFGSNKLLHPIGDNPMYRHIASNINKAGVFYEKIVVTQYEELMNDSVFCDYKIVENKYSNLGISESVKLGIENALKNTNGYCFLVCDQPYLKACTIKEFFEGFKKSGKTLGCVKSGCRLGNPTLFLVNHKHQLLSLEGDEGGKKIIVSQADEDVYFHYIKDEKELFDIDTKETLIKS